MIGKYDIIIIGAGPAGSVFASEISKRNLNLKIAVIDGQTEKNKSPAEDFWRPMRKRSLQSLI